MPEACHVTSASLSSPKGRCLISDKTFEIGDVILQETPYSAVLYDEYSTSRCDCCCQPATKLLRCSGCKLVHYVNRDHQRKAWQQGHKEECAALKQLAPRKLPPTVRLAVRAALVWHRQRQQSLSSVADHLERPSPSERVSGDSLASPAGQGGAASIAGGDPHQTGWAAVLSLEHHWDDLPDSRKVQYAQMGSLAWRALRLACCEASESVTPHDLALLIARFACNNHTICDEELRPVGVGVYPLTSMANHSCTPNAMQAFHGSSLMLRAMRRIQAGEEICISYVELAAPRWERRATLLSQYYFDLDPPTAGEPQQAQRGGGAGEQSGRATVSGVSAAQHAQQGGGGGTGPSAARTVWLSDSVQVRLYRSSVPPWPHDGRDVQMTALLIVPEGAEAPHRCIGGIWGEYGAHAVGRSEGCLEDSWGDPRESFPLDLGPDALDTLPWDAAASLSLATRALDSGQRNLNANHREREGGNGGTATGGSNGSGTTCCTVVHCWVEPEGGGSSDPPPNTPAPPGGPGAAEGGAARVDQGAQPFSGWLEEGSPQLASLLSMAATYAQAITQMHSVEQLLSPPAVPAAVAQWLSPRQGTAIPALLAGSAAAAVHLVQQALCVLPPPGRALSGDQHVEGEELGVTAPAPHRRRKQPQARQQRQAGGESPMLCLGPCHVLRMRLLAAGVRAAVAAGECWHLALDWSRQLLPMYEAAYPKVWPNLGLHWATIAKLEHFVGGRAQQAQQAAQRARNILAHCVASPGGSGVVREMERVYLEAGHEGAMVQAGGS